MEAVRVYWPENLQRLDREAFTTILDEMADLSVLNRVGEGRDHYVLRTAHVAQMLGSEKEVDDAIEHLWSLEPRVDYDKALYRRPIAQGDKRRRSPFSDLQLDDLFDFSMPGCRIVAGTPLLGMDLAVEALSTLAPEWRREGEPFGAGVCKKPAKRR